MGKIFDTLTTIAPTKRSRIGPDHNVILQIGVRWFSGTKSSLDTIDLSLF